MGELVDLKTQPPSAAFAPRSFEDAWRMAQAMAKSGLFGAKNPEQAFALMMLADAEGIHPVAAARDYHIIDGKPSLKADAMLARFQKAGGRVKWLKREDECVSAEFINAQGDAVIITWDKARATKAGLWKNNYLRFPLQMLSARTISEGVRVSAPAVTAGLYTPEEVIDFGPAKPIAQQLSPAQEAGEESDPQPSSSPASPEVTVKSAYRARKDGDWEKIEGRLDEAMREHSNRRDVEAWFSKVEQEDAEFLALPQGWRRMFHETTVLPYLENLPEVAV